MHKMFHLTRQPKRRNTTPESRVPAWFLYQMLLSWTVKSSCEKGGFWSSAQLHSWRNASASNPWDHKISRTISKGWNNSMAGCCNLLRRITNLKCVNSEFKTVDTHPEKGCLKWLHGTMSEPPWKSHYKNGSLYDPAGTES